MGAGGLGWMLLHQLGVHKVHWPLLPSAHGGRVPRDEPGLDRPLAQMRDRRHLLERPRARARAFEEGWRFPADTGPYLVDPSFGSDRRSNDGFDMGAFASNEGSQSGSRPCLGRPESLREWPADVASYCGFVDAESEGDFEGAADAELDDCGDFTWCARDDLWRQRLIAKRRFQTFTGRPPRRRRFRRAGARAREVRALTHGPREALQGAPSVARIRSAAAATSRASPSIPAPWPAGRGGRVPS